MQITLIRPPSYSAGLMGAQLVPYLGVAYIAASARDAGHVVDIVDMCGEDIDRTEIIHGRHVSYGMPLSVLKTRIKPSKVVGITSMFSQDWVFHRELIQHIRKLIPDSIIVAGGEHISAVADYCLKDCPELDVCVIGEGEQIFTHFLSVIENSGSWTDVPGLVYRDKKTKEICHTHRANRIMNIDSIPLPAWDLMPMENYLSRGLTYHIQRGRTIPMLASRGCPYKCTFCSNINMWGNLWRARTPKLVVDEMELYVEKYSANNFVFSDLTAVVRKDKIVALCNEILNRRLNITWQLPTLRGESLDYDVLKLMYKAGCRELDFAVESGSESVLISVNKKNSLEKMVSLIKDGLSAGFNLSINIILGLPKEGVGDFIKTYMLVMKLAIMGMQEVNAFPFVPYPGSKLFKEFADSGKLQLNDKYFLDLFGYADLGKAVSWSERFSPKTLSLMRLFLMSSFYSLMFVSHPRRIVRLVINSMRGVSTTKLEGVLKRILRNIKASQGKKYARKDI